MSSIRPFANEDGYTPFSNYTLDVIMPSLPANAWKVLCFVLRKTQGWQKDMDRLSYGQIEEGTGISSSATISTAIKVLLEKSYIIQVPGSAWKPMGYRINSALEIEEQETTDSTSIPEEQKTNSTSKSKAHSTSKIKVTSEIEPHSDLKIEADSTSIFKDTTERSTERNTQELDNGLPPVSDKPAASRKKQTDPNQSHPAVLAFYQKTARRPNREQARLIAEQVDDLDRWQATLTYWLQRGWSATNTGGMVDRYTQRDDRQQEQGNGTANGHRPVGSGGGGVQAHHGNGLSTTRTAEFDRYLAESRLRYGDDPDG